MFGRKKKLGYQEILTLDDHLWAPLDDKRVSALVHKSIDWSQPPGYSPRLLPTRTTFELWNSWRKLLRHSVGEPSAAWCSSVLDGSAEVRLASWPEGMADDQNPNAGRMAWFNVDSSARIHLVGVFAILFPVHINTTVMNERGFEIPTRPDWASDWECALAVGFTAIEAGIDPELVDCYFWGRNSSWRTFYQRKGARVVRRDDNRPPSIDDHYVTETA